MGKQCYQLHWNAADELSLIFCYMILSSKIPKFQRKKECNDLIVAKIQNLSGDFEKYPGHFLF
jgi:hypothetical protein